MIEQATYEQKPIAFRPEFYEKASDSQIKDDIVSYLGEYRFKVPEFEYRLGIIDGKLVDPNSFEKMTDKAKKAIEIRKISGYSTSREEAELDGLISIEQKLSKNPEGTVLWLSPPGEKQDGYGNYGFAFLGKKQGNELKMLALRLENPTIKDFNIVSETFSKELFAKPEDFLRNPYVLNIDKKEVRNFILGTFQIKPEENNSVFDKAIAKMEKDGVIEAFIRIIKNGSALQKAQAVNAIENLAIELNNKYKYKAENTVFCYDEPINFYNTILNKKYISTPPPVAGSCGMSGKIETSNVLGKLASKNIFKNGFQEWFSCPKCDYKANGPVGNQCPNCGLTKEQYIKDGGKTC